MIPLFTTMPTGTSLLELVEVILTRPNKVPLSSPTQTSKDLLPEQPIVSKDADLPLFGTKNGFRDSKTVIVVFLSGDLLTADRTLGGRERYLARSGNDLKCEPTSTSYTSRKTFRVKKAAIRVGASVTVSSDLRSCSHTLSLVYGRDISMAVYPDGTKSRRSGLYRTHRLF